MHKYVASEKLTLLQYITKYEPYIDFEKLSTRKYVTRDIIDVYKNKIDWKLLSIHNTALTVDDIVAYEDYIDWKLLSKNEELIKNSEKIKELIKKHLEGENK